MMRSVFNSLGTTFIRSEDAEPECGKDFCDTCGDCLHCYGGDNCYLNRYGCGHYWVKYED